MKINDNVLQVYFALHILCKELLEFLFVHILHDDYIFMWRERDCFVAIYI